MNHLKLNKYFIVLAIVTVTAGLLHGILQQLSYVAASTTFTVNSFIDAVFQVVFLEETPHAALDIFLGQFIAKQVETVALIIVRDFVREFLHQMGTQALVQGLAANLHYLRPQQQDAALLLDVV